ncbi:hypothetical protein NQZ68_007256 [Dissostichus eleginoides]|nr:hypothetical protein NQZ68_007256 [Dissostichus eleginoides]
MSKSSPVLRALVMRVTDFTRTPQHLSSASLCVLIRMLLCARGLLGDHQKTDPSVQHRRNGQLGWTCKFKPVQDNKKQNPAITGRALGTIFCRFAAWFDNVVRAVMQQEL